MPTLRILHLSDTHLFGDDSKHYDVVDTEEHLRRALKHIAKQEFDLMVCSGDVSNDGTETSYRKARDVIGVWAAERGARTIFAMGNHDERQGFRAVLGSGQPGVEARCLVGDADPPHFATPTTERATLAAHSESLTEPPIASSATVDGWRTIVLDTSVPRAGYGSLEPSQLDFLRAELASPAPNGTLIIMHHPPIAAQTDLLEALALGEQDAAAFWEIVRGAEAGSLSEGSSAGQGASPGQSTDVRAILCGHYHQPIVEYVHGIPVIVAPGVSNLADAFGPRDEEAASDYFGGATVEITGSISASRVRVLLFTVPVTGAEVFRYPNNIVDQIIRAAGRQDQEK
ncbi:metallophosphoesterase [Leucobacter denitrificans]|uniref:Metallophosphoesterase n=1 Tax=Leucobacter denitrificans TaxID=683042 RepID=A0A7G9S1Z0_9MICO|nr:metallophosphoesterase [Leucobacter denitrificans]QNN61865.1 metallophosphoesterase [Leucobacter denitrificans]